MDPYLGEIRPVAFNFAPQGWALCNGQILPISQYTALFSLLGTTFGGNGTSNFALPNLQDAVPLGAGQGVGLSDYVLGQAGGTEAVELTTQQIPSHAHKIQASTSAATDHSPNSKLPAVAPRSVYSTTGPNQAAPGAITAAGSNFPHNNLQPYLTITYVIAMVGIYPPRP